jgi:hypothetical protein
VNDSLPRGLPNGQSIVTFRLLIIAATLRGRLVLRNLGHWCWFGGLRICAVYGSTQMQSQSSMASASLQDFDLLAIFGGRRMQVKEAHDEVCISRVDLDKISRENKSGISIQNLQE